MQQGKEVAQARVLEDRFLWETKSRLTNHANRSEFGPHWLLCGHCVHTQKFSLDPGSATSWLADLGTLVLDFPSP